METHMSLDLDLIVYLRTKPEVAYERMLKRGREEETGNAGPPLAYLEIVHRAYEDWLMNEKFGRLKPKILVLDEPTSALDIYNEKKIMNDLYSLDGNLTIIIISHRHTLFEKCKKILNLKNGKISETMNYNDLLKNQEIVSSFT